jgi:hypothetical protein
MSNSAHVGNRRQKPERERIGTVVAFEPSAFIGAWCRKTSSFASRLPDAGLVAGEPRFRAALRPIAVLADVAIALTSIAMILSIPGLIYYLASR